MDKPYILIVDDDEGTLKTLTLVLEKKGYEVETARTGQEGLEKARGRFFNLTLLDLRLPDKQGIDLITPLKELHPDMAVILVTAHASMQTVVQALNTGASAYITKPLRMNKVLAAVEEALEKQRLVIENKKLYNLIQQELAERKRVEAQILQLNRELTTLNKVSQAITSTLHLQETLTIIMKHVAQLLNTAAASVVLHDKARDDVWFAAASGEGADFVQGMRLAIGQGIAGWVVQHSEPVLVPDVSRDTRWFKGFDQDSGFTTRSILCVPLRSKGETIGAIEAVNKKSGVFDQEDLRLLASLAAPAATAIENAQLYAQAQHEITERKRAEQLLRTLNAAAVAMERALTTQKVFTAVAEELGKLGFLCAVFSVDKEQRKLLPRYLGYDAKAIKSIEALLDLKIENLALPIETVDLHRETIYKKKTVLVKGVGSIIQQSLPQPLKKSAGKIVELLDLPQHIAAPLIVEDEVIGVFVVHSNDLTTEDIPAITAFAHQVAAAWRKASLMQELESSLEELEQTQSQLVQAQKMEAVGRLAGGMAHDFNNLLTTIMLYTQTLLRKPDLPSDLESSLKVISGESQRAADLVQKMLDFSRRSALTTLAIDLEPFAKDTIDILKHTIPKNIRPTLAMGDGPYIVSADPTQMQQVVMNLAINAQDAMPEGGELHFELSRIQVKPDELPPVAKMPAGEWVRLTISDTGSGMTDDVQSHLFEPFFTTKPVGKGTGLGLAQVYGIVKQHKGYIRVETEVGRGTTFHIYLQANETEEEVQKRTEKKPSAIPKGHGETILLIEDSDQVRQVEQNTLESLGYRVLIAANGQEALEVYRSASKVNLVITEMEDQEVFQEMRKANPHLKGMIITSYPLTGGWQTLKEQGILKVLNKPFDLSTLGKAIRHILDMGADQ